ncbi:M16 family metallopeptidase [Microlunatus flavus]|uniref:Predicted Zn-dependent peptidase n=1 Tax=Microlunatus flavus TaxID=1036181 RepID=A0A1H9I0N7_9ACTN|nr:pitrilysin family protein [Microlunatus flavus]SEQ68127.1 Predicted Zn-dependent peptidase [Microlunatus flavus]
MPSGPAAYPISQHVLDNGLRVLVSPDHGAPVVAVNLWYDVGSRDEEAGRTGFAHLFEHVMFQGSANVASGAHIGLLQAAGASVNATTWFDRTNYFETLPVGGLDLALWLEADRMGSLLDALTEDNLNTQREVVKEEKRQRYDNVPYGDVMQRLNSLTFPADHPYGHTTIGSMADLDAASLADAHAFFARHYMPNNAVLSVVGDVEVDDALARVERYFGGLARGDAPPHPPRDVLGPLTGTEREETSADVPAEAVYLAWRLPARGTRAFDALDLFFGVLGHGQTSRLHKALVRDAEVAESAGAASTGLIGGNSFGYAYARARGGEDLAAVEEALVAQIDRLEAEGPTDTELKRAKAQYERHWLHELSRVDSRADALGEYATLEGDPELVNTRMAEVDAVTPDDVASAVEEWFGSDRRATLLYRKAA